MVNAANVEGRVRPPRGPIPTWYFALVVVRRGHRFLLTQERKYGATWSIPGGRVEPGESLASAAVREVLEETGLEVAVDGWGGGSFRVYERRRLIGLGPGEVFEARLVAGDLRAVITTDALEWFARDALPEDDELAFRWIAPALREWAARAPQRH